MKTETAIAAPPQLLKPAEAAKLLAISERSLWRMAASRELPSIHLGRNVRFSLADLAEFIERQRKS